MINAPLEGLFRIGRQGDQLRIWVVNAAIAHPLHRASGVQQRFRRGEGFGGDGNDCLVRVHMLHRFGQRRTIDVGDNFDVITRAIPAKRVDEQFGTKRGSTNTNMQNVLDIAHCSCINCFNQATHSVLKRSGMGNRIHITVSSLSRMLGSAIFRDIDHCTSKQGRLCAFKAHVVGKVFKMPKDFIIEMRFGQIKTQSGLFQCQTTNPILVRRK